MVFELKIMWGIIVVLVFSILFNVADTCITPLGQRGKCLPIKECPDFANRIRTSMDHQTMVFLRQSKCGCDVNNPRVCCGPWPTHFNEESLLREIDIDELEDSFLPPNNQCGKEKLVDDGDRIIGGKRTQIGEFPWLALLWYRRRNGHELEHKCGGMLINRRYVLTAAHCVTGQTLDEYGKLESVSLGEHDVRNKTDCVEGFCSDPPQTITVLQSYSHQDFSNDDINKQDDIGLIRLARRAKYTDFVQPICLDRSGQWEIGDEVLVAGWGRTLKGIDSPEKLKVSLSIANKARCAQLFRSHHHVTLTKSQVCIGGKFLKDACRGDSGGPAMRRRNGVWEAIGLVSFGYGCARDDWPAVYTVVSTYAEWISNMLRTTNLCP